MDIKIAKLDKWHEIKKDISKENKKIVIPKAREVYWASIGENIGYEQNGKGEIFSRPVLIVKRFSRNMFFGIPLSTQIKDGNFFYNFDFLEQQSNALLVQARLYDTKRLENRLGMIEKSDFVNIKIKLKELLEL
jgi:mRNA interferase MazF